jgi:aspartate kinase
MQNTALSFSVSIDHDERKLTKIIDTLESKFTVKYNTGLELITIRHYDQETIERVSLNKEIILEEKSRHTVQLVARKV